MTLSIFTHSIKHWSVRMFSILGNTSQDWEFRKLITVRAKVFTLKYLKMEQLKPCNFCLLKCMDQSTTVPLKDEGNLYACVNVVKSVPIHGCGSTCVHMHMAGNRQLQMPSSRMPSTFFETGFLIDLELTHSGSLGSQWAPGIFLFLPLQY